VLQTLKDTSPHLRNEAQIYKGMSEEKMEINGAEHAKGKY